MISHGSRPSFLLAALGEVARKRFTAMLAPLGITPGHFGVLRFTSDHDGASQQEVADLLRVRRNVMVGLVDDLEAAGLIRRDRHPVDRRAHALHLTADGRRVLAKARRLSDQMDAEVLAPLPADQREAFRDALLTLGSAAGLECGIYPHEPADLTGLAAPRGA